MQMSEKHGMLQRGKKMNILFICAGNTCRSPMAEYIFREKTKHFKGFYNVHSFGMGAIDGMPASENSVIAMQKRGIDISAHRSKQLSAQMVKDSDFIFCLSSQQYNILINVAPEYDYLITAEAYIGLICIVVCFVCLMYLKFTNRCPHCGKAKQTFGKYCPYCGKEIN